MVRDQVLDLLKNHFADDDSDQVLQLMDGVADIFDKQKKDNNDWKQKYEDLDKSWRKKYKDRFFSKQEEDDQDKEDDYDFDEEKAIEKHRKENPSFEDIFQVRKK